MLRRPFFLLLTVNVVVSLPNVLVYISSGFVRALPTGHVMSHLRKICLRHASRPAAPFNCRENGIWPGKCYAYVLKWCLHWSLLLLFAVQVLHCNADMLHLYVKRLLCGCSWCFPDKIGIELTNQISCLNLTEHRFLTAFSMETVHICPTQKSNARAFR